jgi:hypothetical protein
MLRLVTNIYDFINYTVLLLNDKKIIHHILSCVTHWHGRILFFKNWLLHRFVLSALRLCGLNEYTSISAYGMLEMLEVALNETYRWIVHEIVCTSCYLLCFCSDLYNSFVNKVIIATSSKWEMTSSPSKQLGPISVLLTNGEIFVNFLIENLGDRCL